VDTNAARSASATDCAVTDCGFNKANFLLGLLIMAETSP
jgi:hypothetical protein